MLGPAKIRRVDEPVLASLDALVPAHHFYRHLESTLDLTFVRDLVRTAYQDGGRPSIDPIVFFKLQLSMFFEGLRSERRLIETVSLNLAHRWYLGYALDEPLPDHSSLSRIRARLGVEIFQRFFEQIVDLCQTAGLVRGKELIFDATRVRANADLDSLVPRFFWDAQHHLAQLFEDPSTPRPDQVDALPPVTFDLGLIGWAPTLELTAHVRAKPAPGWLKVRHATRNMAGGMFEEDCEVWDSAGRLVAQSRQLARQPRPVA